jgi:8-amino-7-oxononanoate synthase
MPMPASFISIQAINPGKFSVSELEKNLQSALQQRQSAGLYRQRQIVEGTQSVQLKVDGESLLSFCSNDYLGLANDPRLIKAWQTAAEKFGVGAGASHLVTGHHQAHHDLELELASFMGTERALLFSTGYMANMAIAASLLGRHDVIFEDKLNHASLIDSGRLTRAKINRYPHNDTSKLLDELSQWGKEKKLIMTDGVFSMDGDQADLKSLLPIAEKASAYLLIDDAHGIGVLGEHGRGSFSEAGLKIASNNLVMGTLGKALGVFGAFVAGSETMIETLIQHARSYIYTTALPPAVAATVQTSLSIVQAEDWRRQKLNELINQFKKGAAQLGLDLMPSTTPIQPILFGSAAAALTASQQLRDQGLLVTAIRPPTVPEGSARLRITFSAAHETEHVDRLLSALESVSIKNGQATRS